jgi:hypothetical protein
MRPLVLISSGDTPYRQGIEHLARAVHKGSLEEFLQVCFPETPAVPKGAQP